MEALSLSAYKFVYYMDETSLSLWSSIKKKTFTDGTTTLPYQAKRGTNRTVIGAVGAAMYDDEDNQFQFKYQVVRRTAKEEVREFLELLRDSAPVLRSDYVIFADNHSAHRSKLVTKFIADNNMSLKFLSPYSSPLNAAERVWSSLKSEWSKQIASMTTDFDLRQLDAEVDRVCQLVAGRLRYDIMRSSDKAQQLVLRNVLV